MKKIIVITGASSGIGRELVRQISERETADEIWAIARRADRLEALSAESKIKIRPLCADLSCPDGLEIYRRALEEEKPEISLLCNCAGFGKFNHYERESTETYLNMIDLNVKSVVAMTDYSLPYMKEGSRIMNIASCAAFQPIPYINVYAATKAFVLSYSRALNVELRYRGIRVIAVCPYWTKTEFFDRAIESKDEKQVIINYGVMYDPKKVVARALRDLARGKDISVYGGTNNGQRLLVKLLPHPIVMKVWCRRQKFNGTPDIR